MELSSRSSFELIPPRSSVAQASVSLPLEFLMRLTGMPLPSGKAYRKV